MWKAAMWKAPRQDYLGQKAGNLPTMLWPLCPSDAQQRYQARLASGYPNCCCDLGSGRWSQRAMFQPTAICTPTWGRHAAIWSGDGATINSGQSATTVLSFQTEKPTPQSTVPSAFSLKPKSAKRSTKALLQYAVGKPTCLGAAALPTDYYSTGHQK